MNFWATWCHPCQKEIPDLSKAYDKYKAKGVVILGVMTDRQPERQRAAQLPERLRDDVPGRARELATSWSSFNYPQALPTTFIFDRGGKQVYSHVGPLDQSTLTHVLDQYVSEK